MDSINNIYVTFQTIKEMLTDQQFDISNLKHIDKTELEIIYKKSDNIFAIDVNANTKIVYYMNSKFKIQDLRKFLDAPFSADAEQPTGSEEDESHESDKDSADQQGQIGGGGGSERTGGLKNLILVFKEKINNFNAKNVDDFAEVDLQVFLLKELMYNVSKHSLVPKHIVINDPEKISEIVKMYSLKNKLQLPIILKTDPIARYLNLKSGHLVKIMRSSPTAGISEYYRCCV